MENRAVERLIYSVALTHAIDFFNRVLTC